MKTKHKLLSLILILSSVSLLHSQDISINLSIRWNEGPYILNTDSIVKHSELVVSYTNNSDNNLYFRKFSYYREGIPDFLWGAMETMAFDPEMLEIGYHEYRKKHRDYRNHIETAVKNNPNKNDRFVVAIDLPYTNYADWFIVDEESWYDKSGGCPDIINRNLQYINEYLSDTIYGNNDERNDYITPFKAKDITKRAIKTKTTHQFMFLKAGETKEDVYNLTCFDLVKGTYTFILNGNEFKSQVLTEWRLGEPDKFLPLPKKVGKYKLYSGKFTSNSVTVSF
jgi:hypothetical protein